MFINRKNNPQQGRLRPAVLAFILIGTSLVLHNWWWKVGGIILIVLFIEAYFKYRTLD